MSALSKVGPRGLTFESVAEMKEFCKMYWESGLSPESFKSEQQLFIALQFALECGLPPLKGLTNIAVINGRPCLWGDLLKAMVDDSGLLEEWDQGYSGVQYNDDYTAWVKVKRKGRAPIKFTFSVLEAKDASLWTKKGPWQGYPQRMLLSRARAYALRDVFPDVLMGLHDKDEQQDIYEAEVISKQTSDIPRASLTAPEPVVVLQSRDATPRETVPAKTATAEPKQQQRASRATAEPSPTPEPAPPRATTQAATQAATNTAPPAAKGGAQLDYYQMIVDELKDHPTGYTEAEFMGGLRLIGKTARNGDSIKVIPENRIKEIYDGLKNLLGQIADAHDAQKQQDSPL